MTESEVTYISSSSSDAGAIPSGTPVATHDRASDGAEVQDVFIDPDSVIPLPTGAATLVAQDEMTLYLTQVIHLLKRLVDEQKETNTLLRKIYQ